MKYRTHVLLLFSAFLVAVAVLVTGAAIAAPAESYGRMKGTPAEVISDATAAESLVFNTKLANRARACGTSPTVAVSVALSGASGDTVVVYCALYDENGVYVGETHATAVAGAGLEAAAATQITASGGRTMTFAENTPSADTLTASTGSFISDGYAAGMTLTIASSSSNNGGFRIASVTALVITINASDDFANEGPISATTTVDATGDQTCNLLFLDTAGAVSYEIRHAAPSAGNVDLRWWSVGPITKQIGG